MLRGKKDNKYKAWGVINAIKKNKWRQGGLGSLILVWLILYMASHY